MAERSSKRSSSAPVKKEGVITDPTDTMKKVEGSPTDIPECAVCLQSCIHPVKLPCSHIFCFLCVKGAANQNRRCALCRQAIPMEFFNNPTLIGKKDKCVLKEVELDAEKEHYSWFYEGRNGWWQYDERTNVELEESYNAKKRTFELLIAGYMYVIDLDNMVQMRRNDPSRRRRIKRDLVSAPKKGIAGLKLAGNQDDSAATKEDEQATVPEGRGAAAAGEAPSQESDAAHKAVPPNGTGQTKLRTAGVGKEFTDGNPSNMPVDQYDADDDYDGTDDDEDVEWQGLRRRPAPRRRPELQGCPSGSARVQGNATAQTSTRQHVGPSSRRSNPMGLPIIHQRVSSAPETRPGRYNPLPVTRSTPQDVYGVDQQQDEVDVTGVESGMHSLHVSTPGEPLYEVATVPVQPPQDELRRRRRRQQPNEDRES